MNTGEEGADVGVEDFFYGSFGVVGNSECDNIVWFVTHVIIYYEGLGDVVTESVVPRAFEVFLVEFLDFVECFSCEIPVIVEQVVVDVVVFFVEAVDVVGVPKFHSCVVVAVSDFCVGGDEFVFSEFCCCDVVVLEVEGFPRGVPIVEKHVAHGIFSFLVIVLSIVLL